MNARCRKCQANVECRIEEKAEAILVDGIWITVNQKHAYCPVCGEELFPDQLMDENTLVAHEAYRNAKGSITIREMKALLKKYDIGASPLSKLLGWGENTIERQMKHTMPDPEHAEQLKALFDPLNMCALLAKNGHLLTSIAFNKAVKATSLSLKELFSAETRFECNQNADLFFATNLSEVKSAVSASNEKETEGKEEIYISGYAINPFYELNIA